jgi:predicted Rossmann fold nucleotide-binding protein DprA/Smf involved in DNA uptake
MSYRYALAEIGPQPNQGEKDPDFKDLDEDSRAVHRALGRTPTHPDKLAVELDLPIIRVQQALLQLLLLGAVAERGHGMYVRITKPEA